MELNGKVEFNFNTINNIDGVDGVESILEDIKQISFILLKSIVHLDNHHHNKVDISIKIINNRFEPDKIIDSMLSHIKLIEKDVKKIEKCHSKLKQSISIEDVDGYISYLKTFIILFEEKNSEILSNKLEIAKNLKESIESIVKRREKKDTLYYSFKVSFLTVIALFISSSLLILSFFEKSNGFELAINILSLDIYLFLLDKSDVLWCLFYFWILFYLWKNFCNIKSYIFYEYYDTFKFCEKVTKTKQYKILLFIMKFLLKIVLLLLFIVLGIILILNN